MGSFTSFAETLEKKIRKEIEKELLQEEAPSHFQSEIQSELWTHLIGQVETVYFSQNQKAQAYHRFRTPPPPRPNHVLTGEQEKALQFFHKHNVELPLNFSQQDLYKAFRQLALKLHPDHGGSSAGIQALLQARQELQSLFNKST